ncbi:glycosyl transferase [Curtobacterium sp. MCPF17_011]|nr:glycosyl transferase [Curtobacterium sp. MCPF17_011]
MPSFLLCAPPMHGHVMPVIELGRGLLSRGADVTVLTGRRYEDAVLRSGLTFAPLPAEVDYDDSDLEAWLPGRGAIKGLAAMRREMIGMFARVLPGQWRAVQALLAAHRFDGIIGDATFTGLAPYSSRPAAERLPVIGVSPIPVVMTSVDTGPFGLVLAPAKTAVGRLRNRALTSFLLRGPLRPIGIAVDEALAEVGEPPTTVSFYDHPYVSYDRLFQLSIAELEYPRRDLPDTVRFVGPMRHRHRVSTGVPGWWADLDSGRPVVHVSQGTMDNRDLGRVIVPTLRALADEDVLVVAATGGRPVDDVVRAMGGRLPANARVEEYVPYDELLPRCAVFVTNGGFGGVQRAIAAGLPLVVAGATEDKPEIAARVQWAGCGIDLRTGTPTPEQVRGAVRRVLADDRTRRGSEFLRDRMNALPDPVDVIWDTLAELTTAGSSRGTGQQEPTAMRRPIGPGEGWDSGLA